jgi:hypothetical protein
MEPRPQTPTAGAIAQQHHPLLTTAARRAAPRQRERQLQMQLRLRWSAAMLNLTLVAGATCVALSLVTLWALVIGELLVAGCWLVSQRIAAGTDRLLASWTQDPAAFERASLLVNARLLAEVSEALRTSGAEAAHATAANFNVVAELDAETAYAVTALARPLQVGERRTTRRDRRAGRATR